MSADPRTWDDLARMAGCENVDVGGYALWNCTAFPFASVRTIWQQLRHAVRFAKRTGRWPADPDHNTRLALKEEK